MDADGNLYGTTKLLGANGVGTIWEVPSGSNSITVLAPMIGTDGHPEAIGGLVMDGDGNLYGAAVDGGTDSEGSVSSCPREATRSASWLPSTAATESAPLAH